MTIEILRGIERIVVSMSVPLLIYIGYLLFLKGATGQMDIIGKKDSFGAKITNVTPGALCFILAVGLGGYIMFSKVPIVMIHGEGVYTLGGYAGGDSGEIKPLSRKFQELYSEAGFKVQTAIQTGQLDKNKIDEAFAHVDDSLKERVTFTQYRDLLEIEKKAADGDDNSLTQIQEWRSTYLK